MYVSVFVVHLALVNRQTENCSHSLSLLVLNVVPTNHTFCLKCCFGSILCEHVGNDRDCGEFASLMAIMSCKF